MGPLRPGQHLSLEECTHEIGSWIAQGVLELSGVDQADVIQNRLSFINQIIPDMIELARGEIDGAWRTVK